MGGKKEDVTNYCVIIFPLIRLCLILKRTSYTSLPTALMASSSVPQHDQRENTRLQQDTRSRSILGIAKNFIITPLSWFMKTNQESTNDYEERDGAGKRRRSAEVGTDRVKRVRFQSGQLLASSRQEFYPPRIQLPQ